MQNRAVQILAGLVFLLLVLSHGKTIISLLIPVIVACFFTLLFLPLVDRLETKIKSRLASTLIVLVPALTGIFWTLSLIVARLYREAEGFVKNFPEVVSALEKTFDERIWPLVQGTQYEDTFFVILDEIIVRGVQTLQSVAMRLIDSGISFLWALPGLFIGIMVTIILSFYLIYDKRWLLAVLPGVSSNIDKVIHSIHGFVKVQFFLISITAGICMIAFQLMGIPYVFAFGATIAIFDLLPILGAGTLMIPMAIWYILMGMPILGITIGILYVVIVAVRQVVEPKLLSANLGIHPIVAILCLFLGLQLFGIMGLVLLPLVASIAASFPRFQWLKR